jgi:hypothetical protein
MPENKYVKRSWFSVKLRNEVKGRLKAAADKMGCSEAEVVELGLNLAVVANDGMLFRVMGPGKDRDGRVLSVQDILKKTHYIGQRSGA